MSGDIFLILYKHSLYKLTIFVPFTHTNGQAEFTRSNLKKYKQIMMTTYLLHVKKGYEDRLEHMTSMLSAHNITFELILDGDIPDLTDEIIEKYFSEYMCAKSATTSCACKHILCYEKMVSENIDYALILEDDMFFSKKFDDILQRTITERLGDKSPWYVGFEASCLKFVPRSQRKKWVVTYKGECVQCTGAYLINLPAARAILDCIKANKCNVLFDWYLDKLQNEKVFELYWTYPPVAEQGSHNGKMQSGISSGLQKSKIRFIKRKITTFYKECLYFFR